MKTIVQVKMLVDTTFGGQRLHVGDEVGVVEEVGQRWAKRNIAKLISEPAPQQEASIEELSAKQLYTMCIEKGIEVQPKMKKEDYITLLKQEG